MSCSRRTDNPSAAPGDPPEPPAASPAPRSRARCSIHPGAASGSASRTCTAQESHRTVPKTALYSSLMQEEECCCELRGCPEPLVRKEKARTQSTVADLAGCWWAGTHPGVSTGSCEGCSPPCKATQPLLPTQPRVCLKHLEGEGCLPNHISFYSPPSHHACPSQGSSPAPQSPAPMGLGWGHPQPHCSPGLSPVPPRQLHLRFTLTRDWQLPGGGFPFLNAQHPLFST